ncbi:MAG: DUF512 domain-containing protein [Acutalibacteraceae bacterium]|nr:DUF512 domain-containing protein [Acutalibacteraceae bacterium]
MAVKIDSIEQHSRADKKGIKAGDTLLTINGNDIIDVLDYRFYQDDKRLKLEIQTQSGKVKKITVHKGEYEELGLEFDSYLMDSQRSCKNKCIFCFIDQLPKGLRESLYFKDDDSRLSFLFGNYITLTGLTEHEISRIIKMHISPVNISVHTTNPELRCKMMNNRFAGECLDILRRFDEAGISMNCQLVLCPEYNDGDELRRSLNDLLGYENVRSVACVPVGLTKFRENLTEIKPYNKERAQQVLDIIEEYAKLYTEKYGQRKVYAADEFYLTAENEIPHSDFYGDFDQLDNGVGMWALLRKEAFDAIENFEGKADFKKKTVVTGVAAYPLLSEIVERAKTEFEELDCQVIAIKNDFFGERITVSGLVTGCDIISQLKDRDTGEEILIPSCMLRYENDLFLDGTSVTDVENKLNVKVIITENDGYNLIDNIMGVKEDV